MPADPKSGSRAGQRLERVVQLRLSAEVHDVLRREAAESEVAISDVARGYIVAGLVRSNPHELGHLVDRQEHYDVLDLGDDPFQAPADAASTGEPSE